MIIVRTSMYHVPHDVWVAYYDEFLLQKMRVICREMSKIPRIPIVCTRHVDSMYSSNDSNTEYPEFVCGRLRYDCFHFYRDDKLIACVIKDPPDECYMVGSYGITDIPNVFCVNSFNTFWDIGPGENLKHLFRSFRMGDEVRKAIKVHMEVVRCANGRCTDVCMGCNEVKNKRHNYIRKSRPGSYMYILTHKRANSGEILKSGIITSVKPHVMRTLPLTLTETMWYLE